MRVGRVTGIWRRSIQARVVLSTVVLSAVVTSLVGWVLLRQITDGLLESKVETSIAEAARGTQEAQDRLRVASTREFDSSTQLSQVVTTLVGRGLAQGYDVVIAGPLTPAPTRDPAGGAPPVESVREGGLSLSPGLLEESVPEALVTAVGTAGTRETPWTYTRVRYRADTDRESAAAVAVGSQVVLPADGDAYAVYYLFPLTDQERTLSLVRQALLTSGVLLLLLVAGVTWLVARQVVTPVRLARRVAERLASGRLEERMMVEGEDDIARLGTSFNQMADSLQKQIRKLEDMSAAQRRFVSDVSHELRTPLTTVRMAGDVLHDARSRFDPVTARAAELLQNELDRFESLLTDLLEISRFDAGAAGLDLEDVNLADVAHRVVESTRALAEARGTHVVVLPPERPCIAEVDVRRVERIVRNLVTNAIDYADSSDVVIRLDANDGAAALAVRDYGVGLKPGDEVRVFNRFWRADPARARTTGGTGLGLSISLEDARLHGGTLDAWGEPGRGSQFRLTLPRRAGDPVTASPLPRVPADRMRRRAGAS